MELSIDLEQRAGLARSFRVASNRAFASVVLDVDSTVSAIEGLHWLAARRGDIVAHRVAAWSAEAEDGTIPLERAFAEQLAAIRPRRAEVDELSRAYVASIAPGCRDALIALRRAGVRVVLVSDSLRHALYRLAFHLGLDSQDVHAIDVRFDAVGAYAGFNRASPLLTATGKRDVVAGLGLDGPVLAVGDGRTDREIRSVVDRFAAFTGFVTRSSAVEGADAAAPSFDHIASIVLNRTPSPLEISHPIPTEP